MIKSILVPVDGSEHADQVIEFAAVLAEPNDATVCLLHVTKRTEVPQAVLDYMHSEGIKENPHAVYSKYEEDRILIPATDEAKRKGIEHIKTACIQGDPAEKIIDYAAEHEFDLIVMGSRGLNTIKARMTGSVATKVCREADRTCVIVRKNLLDGKKVLVVDDEPDVLDSLEDLLPMCDVEKAFTFDEAKDKLENQYFDLAILDIMGVDGYSLLDIANDKNVTAIMLTAHALSVKDIIKSHKRGAASYIPKEKLAHITIYCKDVLEAKEKGKNFWWRWLERFGSYFNEAFGSDWQQHDAIFWDKFRSY